MKKIGLLLLALLMVVGMVGCSSSGGDGGGGGDPVGSWDIVYTAPGHPDNTWVMDINGDGSARLSYSGDQTGTWSVNGNTITFRFIGGGYVIDQSGTLDGNSMSGSWSNNAGVSGAWSATKR